jgi:DNA (cytosine-5)-methyltransferase 1
MIRVCDFFSGCGGASSGFQNSGMEIILGVDIDPDAEKSFLANHKKSNFLRADIASIQPSEISSILELSSGPLLFSGCAPCQPFTRQNTTKKSEDPRRNLLLEFGRFVENFLPDYVFLENVPGLQKLSDSFSPFNEFIALLSRVGYAYQCRVISAWDYGVPQRRKRLVLLASRHGAIDLPCPTHGPATGTPDYATVRQFIADLPHIDAGETDTSDPIHRAAALSSLNKERIASTPPEGSRLDWPPHLRLKCHSDGYVGHSDVYGRMRWDQPATGLTTRCVSLSNGRFGHPEQNRAITVREAACLQTFPRDFKLFGNLNSMARQIGNAVPVLLAQRFGEHILAHWNKLKQESERG